MNNIADNRSIENETMVAQKGGSIKNSLDLLAQKFKAL